MLTYEDYHANPINKIIHAICIPLIVITSMNFLSQIAVKVTVRHYFLLMSLAEYLMIFMFTGYFYYYGLFIFICMYIYLLALNYVSYHWTKRSNYFNESLVIFIGSWIAQFIGHYIEGNRPALFTSITQAFLQAPLFSLDYIIPIYK